MSQVLKEDIRARILECARDEFYNNDYNSAKLREIAKNSQVSLGLIYSYFENKQDLFCAVVSPVLEEIRRSTAKNERHEQFDECISKEIEEIPFLLSKYRKELVILIDKSAGTVYEGAKQKIIEMAQSHIEVNLGKMLREDLEDMDSLFYHILASNFMEGIFEIARHYVDYEWAKRMVDILCEHYYYGIKTLIK